MMVRAKNVSPRAFGRIAGTLFFAFFLALGILFCGLMGRSWWRQLQVHFWQAAPARILEVRVIGPSDDQRQPELYVKFEYTVGGVERISQAYDVEKSVYATSDAYRLAEDYEVGRACPCYVNPRDLDQAVLRMPNVAWGFGLLLPLVFVAVGAVGMVATWRRGKAVSEGGAMTEQALKTKRRSVAGPRVLFGFFAVLGGVGTYFLGVAPVLSVVTAKNWVETQCEVVSSRVFSHSDSHSTTYSVDIVFRYSLGGRTYTANRYSFVHGSSSGYEGKARIVAEYPPGKRAICFVDPRNPVEAVLNRGLCPEMAFGFIPAIFLAIGLGGWFWSAKRGATGANASIPLGVPAGGLWADPGMSTQLKPAAGRKAKLAVLVGISLFWNGIVAVFVFQTVNAWAHHGGAWFPTLFLVPFVLVGLGLFWGVIYQFLGLFNPRAELSVGNAEIHVGDEVELTWQFSGSCDRMRMVRMYLEGREQATYRRGTDSVTDKSVFAELPIYQAAGVQTPATGSARVKLPARTMHSFDAPNNKIVWSVRVKGDVPWWPDVDDEFPIVVMPERIHP